MAGRVVEEIAAGRRLVREYDDAGRLLRIRLLPLSRGATADLPPVERAPEPPAAEVSRSSAARALFWRKRPDKPAAPQPAPDVAAAPVEEPAPAQAPAPAAPRIHVRFEDEPSTAVEGIEVVVEPLPIVFRFTAPPVAAPEPEPAPAPIVFVEPEPLAPEPDPLPPPKPLAFEVVAVEEVREPEPEPEPPAPMAEPPAPPAEVAPPPPEPVPLQEERAPESRPEPAREEPPVPEPPASYAALVPDVDEKVDAVLARQDAPDKRRKRAPIPAPAFEPLRREPWEDRLDAVLGR